MRTTVLVVDDSLMMRKLVARTLDAAGFDVCEAEDGVAALSQLVERPSIALVICDVNMPNMNGIEFLQALHAEPHTSKVPVLILTTRGQLDLVSQARTLGAKFWLLKPFVPEQLIEVAKQLAPREA